MGESGDDRLSLLYGDVGPEVPDWQNVGLTVLWRACSTMVRLLLLTVPILVWTFRPRACRTLTKIESTNCTIEISLRNSHAGYGDKGKNVSQVAELTLLTTFIVISFRLESLKRWQDMLLNCCWGVAGRHTWLGNWVWPTVLWWLHSCGVVGWPESRVSWILACVVEQNKPAAWIVFGNEFLQWTSVWVTVSNLDLGLRFDEQRVELDPGFRKFEQTNWRWKKADWTTYRIKGRTGCLHIFDHFCTFLHFFFNFFILFVSSLLSLKQPFCY